MNDYSAEVVDHFQHPRNAGPVEDANGTGEIGNPDRGDYIKVFIRIDNEILAKIGYQVKGSAAAVACASAMTELVVGRHVDDVMMLTDEDIVEALNGLPESDVECPNLSARGLKTALQNYFERNVRSRT